MKVKTTYTSLQLTPEEIKRCGVIKNTKGGNIYLVTLSVAEKIHLAALEGIRNIDWRSITDKEEVDNDSRNSRRAS